MRVSARLAVIALLGILIRTTLGWQWTAMPDERQRAPRWNESSRVDPAVQPIRPTVDPMYRYHPIPDPAVYYQPSQIYLRLVGPSDCSFTLYAAGGKPIVLGAEVLAGVRTRARYAFALSAGTGENRHRYYGTIDVIRGPLVPRDVKPLDATIPIVFDEEDMLHIVRERMITKFLVLENPETALDYPSDPNLPIRYDASLESDAVRRANELGKILIVVRIGNRIPTEDELATTSAGSLLLGKTLQVVDSKGQVHLAGPEFVAAEDYPEGSVQQVSHFHTGRMPAMTENPGAGCADGACRESRPSSPPGVDPRLLLNNDLTNNFEYLCDGGDRRPRVGWAAGGQVVNINPEDTVAEYRTAVGGKRFAVSNRVCLFSPRYVELRVLQSAEGYAVAVGHGAVGRDHRPEIYLGQAPPLEKKTYRSAGLVRSEKAPRGLASEQWSGSVYEVRVLTGIREALGWGAMIGLFGSHHVTGSLQPEILARTAFADTLTADQMPQIVGMAAGTGEVYAYWHTEEVVGIELRPEKPDVLKIEKTADRSAAKVGESVVFVIRYTNTGKQPITNIGITDSLTTRLEYVDESADSDRPAVFAAKPNDAGSMVLRWEIKDPLPPNESGHLRFTAKVR